MTWPRSATQHRQDMPTWRLGPNAFSLLPLPQGWIKRGECGKDWPSSGEIPLQHSCNVLDGIATLTIKLDGNWNSFQLANSAPPLSVTDSAIAPSARINLISGYFGGEFSFISAFHTAYIGEDSSILGTWNSWWFLLWWMQIRPGKNPGKQRSSLKLPANSPLKIR